MKKGVVLDFTTSDYEMLKAGRIHFPGPITIAAETQLVAKDGMVVRIEADWLPEWAEISADGYFPNGICELDAAGCATITQGEQRPCVPAP